MKSTEPRWWELAIARTFFEVFVLLVSFPRRRLRKTRRVVIRDREAA